jgi:NAD(P)-dependent dehydrogenase (short-subunit alcohol dehydrogenase family)
MPSFTSPEGSSAPAGGFSTLTGPDREAELQLNLLGAVRLDRGLVPAMIRRGQGAIVHVSSIQRRMPLDDWLPYARRQGRAQHLQQGPLQRARAEGHPGLKASRRAGSRPTA